VRIHVLPKEGNKSESLYVVDRLYGSPLYAQAILAKLKEQFGTVYSGDDVYSQDLTTRYGKETVHVKWGTREVYTDYVFDTVRELTEVSLASVFKKDKDRRYRGTLSDGTYFSCSQRTLNTLNSKAVNCSSDDRLEDYKLKGQATDAYFCAPGLVRVMMYLCRKYNKPYTVDHKGLVCDWITGQASCVDLADDRAVLKWKFRGYRYQVVSNYSNDTRRVYYILVRRKVTTTGYSQQQQYNMQTAAWVVSSSKYVNYSNEKYRITRHTIHMLDKFLPKNAAHFKNHSYND
jgi:hypothetical protein